MQAFRPLTARHLLELPLTIMDTALFYPSHLNLRQDAAHRIVGNLVHQAERYGGALTINWHDRSLAPERWWDSFYFELLEDLKRRHAWFPTAAEAVRWFSRRRSAIFNSVRNEDGMLQLSVSADDCKEGPDLTLRIHTSTSRFTDQAFSNGVNAMITD
jgi:hypothetical protein